MSLVSSRYALGAISMTLTQNLTTIIVFWAIIGGLGASLLLPAMQSLIHGNFEGAARKEGLCPGRRGDGDCGCGSGPLLGGFITTYLSWRVGFLSGSRDHRHRTVQHQTGQRCAVYRSCGGSM